MTLTHILVFCAAIFLAALLFKAKGREWFLLGGSVLALYWLQPATPIRHLDFWLPTASLALTVWVWFATQKDKIETRQTAQTMAVIGGLALLVGAMRYLPGDVLLTPTRPPQVWQIALALGVVAVPGAILVRWQPARRRGAAVLPGLLFVLFIVLKTTPLAEAASAWLRAGTGQSTKLANALDLRWLGFSYLAFRLLHILRDFSTGRLPPALSLREFVIYALFFPAFTAGPIDRIQRFIRDLRAAFQFSADEILAGGTRLARGVFKKFVLADALALIALNEVSAAQTESTFWLWALLYGYALRIYFDFSGYTDIALGLGLLLGVKLPENFDRPYLKPNLTTFWNSWHMTLAQWFRAYFFNPLTRALRTRKKPVSIVIIILLGQVGTMALIGLWHGVTWNFFIWGVWHGVGLFVHNRWSTATRMKYANWPAPPRVKSALAVLGTLLTFHFVALGWVWFALPSAAQALAVFRLLFGGG